MGYMYRKKLSFTPPKRRASSTRGKRGGGDGWQLVFFSFTRCFFTFATKTVLYRKGKLIKFSKNIVLWGSCRKRWNYGLLQFQLRNFSCFILIANEKQMMPLSIWWMRIKIMNRYIQIKKKNILSCAPTFWLDIALDNYLFTIDLIRLEKMYRS